MSKSQVDILALDPRPNPDGKTYGTNSQKFAGYQFRVGRVDGRPYSRAGGDEAITVFEFVKTPGGKMAWGKPLYMYTFPNLTDAGGQPPPQLCLLPPSAVCLLVELHTDFVDLLLLPSWRAADI